MWCKLGRYCQFIFPCLSSTYIGFVSLDRFCVSLLNDNIRKYTKVKVARLIVILIFLFWAIFGIHIIISYTNMEAPAGFDACMLTPGSPSAFVIISGLFALLYNGAIIPFFLFIFGLLIFFNVRKSRRRVHAQTQARANHISRQNNQMLILVLFQVILTIFLNVPYAFIFYLNELFPGVILGLESCLLWISILRIAR